MNVINKLIMRLNTAKTRALPMNDPASWTLQRGLGALDGIAITEIDNPIPNRRPPTSTSPDPTASSTRRRWPGGCSTKTRP